MLASLSLFALSELLTVLLVVAGAAVLFGLFAVGIYNSLVRGKVETENAWSQIDVQLKRRYDLIPNLVETVKGYAKHESGTLEAVIQARNAAMSAGASGDRQQQIAAENQITGALKTIFALSEAYPDLKANTNFLALQEELSSTENKIGFARQNYNDTVGNYNKSLQVFPNNIVGGMFRFQPVAFFQLDEGEKAAVRTAPKVQF